MADKRFYWIKLKDSFMTSDKVDFLMSQRNGAQYVVLYQMLCLKTINTGGELARQLGEYIVPFDIEKIQRDCKFFDVDTIRIALELYTKLGLIFEQENGILKITDFNNLVGSEVSSASRVREHRKKKYLEKALQPALQCNSDVTQEIRDKRIDIRDKDKDNRNNTKNICELIVRARENEPMKLFLEKHPQIQIDGYNGNVSEIDFKVLEESIAESDYLKKITSFSWLCKQWQKIAGGYYKTIKVDKSKKQDEPTCDIDFSEWQV